MYIKQLSVFIENREGRLEDVLNALKENDVNIISLSLADTSEYGLLRMIVSDPEKGKAVLKENEFSAKLTEVLAIRMRHQVGSLQELLSVICQAGINIEYTYAFSTGQDDASLIIKTSNLEEAEKLLADKEVEIFGIEDIARIPEQ